MFIPGPIVRHSSVHPNCKAKLWKHKFGCDLVLKATRNIAEGEELLWDHGSDASDKTCICAKCNGLCSCDECGGHHLHGPYMGNLNSQYKVDPLLSMVTFDDGKMAAVMLNCIDMIRNVISNNLPHVSTDGQSELFEKMLTLLDTRVEDSKVIKQSNNQTIKQYQIV